MKKLKIILAKSMYPLLSNKIWKNVLESKGLTGGIVNNNRSIDIVYGIFTDKFKSSNKMNSIQLLDMCKTYENGFKAINKFNLEIKPKDFVCLLGPSGCGKTTALRMVAGLEEITDGKYFSGNKEMNSLHPSERNTSMVFQNYALYPFMTVYNNVAFGLKLKTYKNDLFVKMLDELELEKKPLREEIKDVKFELKTLKSPLGNEIKQLQIKHKKAVKSQDEDKVINSIKDELDKTIKENELLISKSEEKKEALTKKLNDILAKNKALKDENVAKNKDINAKAKAEIARLKTENKDYYETKKAELPELKQKIKDLAIKINEYKKVKKTQSKEKLAQINGSKRLTNDELKQYKIEFKKIDQEFNEKTNQIHDQMVELIQLKSIIKNKNAFLIKDQKDKIITPLTEVIKLVEIATVWKKTIPYRVKKIASLVGIENFLNRKPAHLSGGQRQRVALIRAISKDAQLFLFDEPLSNLDAKLRSTMRNEIKKIHESTGATSIYVTHDQIEAMTMADKVVVMNIGYIQQVGSPKDLYDNPSNLFVAQFIGVPSINVIKGSYSKGKFVFENGIEQKIVLSKEKMKLLDKHGNIKKAVIGIRPQDIVATKATETPKTGIFGSVNHIELTGNEFQVKFLSNIGKIITATVPGQTKIKIGDSYKLEFNTAKSHIFDQITGKAYSSVLNSETEKAFSVWDKSTKERIFNKKLLDYEKNKEPLSKKIRQNVSGQITEKGRDGLNAKKIEKATKIFEDYSLAKIEDDEIES